MKEETYYHSYDGPVMPEGIVASKKEVQGSERHDPEPPQGFSNEIGDITVEVRGDIWAKVTPNSLRI